MMIEEYNIESSREIKMEVFLDYVSGYMDMSLNYITNLANFSAIVAEYFDDINWVGFYLYDGEKLYLGPFQGKPACVEIQLGKGVCGSAAMERRTIVVPDTDVFPGHIVCDASSKSEIVIPIYINKKLFGVLDIDSPSLDRFDELDREVLEKAVNVLVDIL